MVQPNTQQSRRELLGCGAALGVMIAVGLTPRRVAGDSEKQVKASDAGDADISPAEDLMREHGVLERILLVYEASLARWTAREGSPLAVMVKAADVVRRFIEEYHERLEEEFLFPRFEAAGSQIELVRTLRVQHQRGRALTDDVRRLAAAGSAPASPDAARLREAVTAFVRMYRPHAAREDTVLFPAFRTLVSGREYDELGERFEDKEHALFGESGFHAIVEQVADLEKSLDIYDLNRFTPA